MIWRIKFAVNGGHVRCRLFCSKSPNMTFASCGEFTVCRGDEFASLMTAFDGAQFIGDDPAMGIVQAVEAA